MGCNCLIAMVFKIVLKPRDNTALKAKQHNKGSCVYGVGIFMRDIGEIIYQFSSFRKVL